MKIMPGELKLYAVTDRAWARDSDGVIRQVEAAVKGGATFVQVREKNLPPREFLSEARWIVELCHKNHVRCVINDNVDVALLSGADGVHVGQDDMACEKARAMLGAGRIIGVSAHNVEQALAAERAGADYLGSGAAFGHQHQGRLRPVRHARGLRRDNRRGEDTRRGHRRHNEGQHLRAVRPRPGRSGSGQRPVRPAGRGSRRARDARAVRAAVSAV